MNILKKAGNLIGKKDLTFSPSDTIEKVIASLGGKFTSLLENTFSERFQDNANTELTPDQVKKVINKYSNLNVAIAAASAAVPGPLGILSSAGELVLVTGNQLKMIYDVGCAYDKEDFVNKDLLIDIPLQAMGVSTNLDEMQNQLGSLADSPLGVIQEKATSYAKVIAIKNLKKSLVKFVPVAGSLVMSIWTKKSTMKIANVAEDFIDDAKVLKGTTAKTGFQEEEPKEILVERIKIMATLMEQNGQIKEEELAFLVPVIESAAIEEKEKAQLLEEAKRLGSHFKIDYAALQQFPDVVDDLISDMLVLAKRDGEVGPNEMAFLKHVNQQLGEKEEDLLALLA